MYHIVYKTTHVVTGKYYIGIHSTHNINDDYLGSGKYIKASIKKYGRDAFIRDILHFCNSKEETYTIERNIVTELFLRTENTFNLAEGGRGHQGQNKNSKTILLYDEHLQLLHTFVSTSKASKFLKCTHSNVRGACNNSMHNKSSFVKGFYACYEGYQPIKRDFSYLITRNKTILSIINTGTKRPDHSIFMKKRATDNPTGQQYFTPMHINGTTRSQAINYYSTDMINAWCKHFDQIICKMAITKLKTKLGDKVTYDWVGKTRKEVGFFSQPR